MRAPSGRALGAAAPGTSPSPSRACALPHRLRREHDPLSAPTPGRVAVGDEGTRLAVAHDRGALGRSRGNARNGRLRLRVGMCGSVERRRFLTTYPVDFYRRAQQKWVRRLQSLRMPVGALEAYLDSVLKGGTETSG